ncbi:hypothetical protein MIZ01_0792 [Sideroxyarcus emersonii]|uniref:Outer membrane protein beta-barrel domain-containing protein n=1 Tax=Sideroxyarcus emersonii TaxID=2764705 RepID=A0AAN2BYR7_9PROT|nr:hypothetical protein [Sideroxyarcus emersonii]BCK87022.1 hypothetical protein MIZ01_0792 [Sideroxyarcus emersonii]
MSRLLLTILLSILTLPACAADVAGIFDRGSTQFSLVAGSGSAFNNSYLILGAGTTYYVADGVGVGLSYENWSGSSPGINKISPSVQYVFNRQASLWPYMGGFYRHSVISGLPGINSVGARAGVYFAAGHSSVAGVGLAYESYLNCQTAIYNSCSEIYPEISFIFGF